MKKENKKLLTSIMSSLLISSFALPVFAEETNTALHEYSLEGVVVESDSTGKTNMPGGFQNNEARFGIFGETDIMKVPMTVHSISEKTLEQQMGPNGTLQDVMSNVPGITVGTSPIKTDFSIRGMAGNAALMTYNNIPGFFIMAIGPEDYTIGSMDVIVGPAATLTGSHKSDSGSYSASENGTPGSISLYTKRALKDDHFKYIQSMSGYGNYGEAFDISRRFGKDREWGIRIYGQKAEGGLPISGAGINRKNISVDVSRETEKANTNFFFTSFDKKHHGTDRRFLVDRFDKKSGDSIKSYPKAPDNDKNYEIPGMYQQSYGWITTLNHEQKMDKNSSWFINAGKGKTYIRRFIYNGEMNIDAAGNFKDTKVWSNHFAVDNNYIQMGIKDKAKLGSTTHNLSLAVDRADVTWYNNNQNFEYGIPHQSAVFGNIYDKISWTNNAYKADKSREMGKRFRSRERDVSLNIADNIEWGKWNLMVAGTRRHGSFLSKAGKTQKVENNVHDSNWTPTYGVSYAPNENLTFYGARAYSINRGAIVSDTYDNGGEYLPPVKTKNDEIGVKFKHKNMFYSLAYFDLKQANYNTAPDNNKIYGIFGKQHYKGVDFTATGKLADKWNMFGGFEYLKTEQNTSDIYNGKPVDGAAKWHGVLGLEYKPTENSSITGRFNYSDSSQYVWTNKAGTESGVRSLPAWKTFDLFASQKTHIGTTPVTFRAQIYNLFNSSHWIGKTGEGTKFLLSNPRTIVVSAEFDLDKMFHKKKK